MKDLECPYCNAELEVCHDDGYGFEEGVKHEMDCSICGKNFVFETEVVFFYESFKADCLNGANHNYDLSIAHPNFFSDWKCKDCHHRVRLTEEELKANGLQTKEEYLGKLNLQKHDK